MQCAFVVVCMFCQCALWLVVVVFCVVVDCLMCVPSFCLVVLSFDCVLCVLLDLGLFDFCCL